ncbi:MAG: DNA polymerase III subunit epsilon [Hyphomonadaceae bacterium]|nr:DNA polymerase III subunit epsilon [Hyphomonadaceae bacterium]
MTEILREIAFDTETTGLDAQGGDRIIEVGCVEMINHVPTGKNFRMLINPGREVSEATIRITGLTDDILSDKPTFEDPSVVDALVDFIGDAQIVAHNASFDRGFLNMEMARCGRAIYGEERWVDTLMIARKRYPGAPASLDALCRRFDISLESRTLHGALLDAQLLADVYLELRGGRARSFEFDAVDAAGADGARQPAEQRPELLKSLLSEEEEALHRGFIATMSKKKPVWERYG